MMGFVDGWSSFPIIVVLLFLQKEYFEAYLGPIAIS